MTHHEESHTMLKAVAGSSVSILGAIGNRWETFDAVVRSASGIVSLLAGILTLVFIIGPKVYAQWRKWRK